MHANDTEYLCLQCASKANKIGEAGTVPFTAMMLTNRVCADWPKCGILWSEFCALDGVVPLKKSE